MKWKIVAIVGLAIASLIFIMIFSAFYNSSIICCPKYHINISIDPITGLQTCNVCGLAYHSFEEMKWWSRYISEIDFPDEYKEMISITRNLNINSLKLIEQYNDNSHTYKIIANLPLTNNNELTDYYESFNKTSLSNKIYLSCKDDTSIRFKNNKNDSEDSIIIQILYDPTGKIKTINIDIILNK